MYLQKRNLKNVRATQFHSLLDKHTEVEIDTSIRGRINVIHVEALESKRAIQFVEEGLKKKIVGIEEHTHKESALSLIGIISKVSEPHSEPFFLLLLLLHLQLPLQLSHTYLR